MDVKFIADSMLGKLARWLRLMGFDTLYYPSIPDEELLKIARQEERIILTKDTELTRRNKDNNLIHITSSDPYEQIKTVIKTFNLNPWENLFTRCVHCNKPVEKVDDAERIKEKVPFYAYSNHFPFYRCCGCGRIYWEGSHHEKIKMRIKSFLEGKDEV
ncbi:Mut7-C RNAse domain-containing protein [Candidatus Aerophobetes bacterium]|nr:Mut7-C RNAse domain-containing protein [Candidatus Aerophobetes bacterium]